MITVASNVEGWDIVMNEQLIKALARDERVEGSGFVPGHTERQRDQRTVGFHWYQSRTYHIHNNILHNWNLESVICFHLTSYLSIVKSLVEMFKTSTNSLLTNKIDVEITSGNIISNNSNYFSKFSISHSFYIKTNSTKRKCRDFSFFSESRFNCKLSKALLDVAISDA